MNNRFSATICFVGLLAVTWAVIWFALMHLNPVDAGTIRLDEPLVGPVRFGMTRKQVVAKLGQPFLGRNLKTTYDIDPRAMDYFSNLHAEVSYDRAEKVTGVAFRLDWLARSFRDDVRVRLSSDTGSLLLSRQLTMADTMHSALWGETEQKRKSLKKHGSVLTWDGERTTLMMVYSDDGSNGHLATIYYHVIVSPKL